MFNRLEKGNVYASRIVEYFPERKTALAWEVQRANYLKNNTRNSMKYHIRP